MCSSALSSTDPLEGPSQHTQSRPCTSQYTNVQARSLLQHVQPGTKRIHRPAWAQSTKKKTKKVKLRLWEHEFVCLSECNQITPPSAMERIDLIRGGLGPKKIPFVDFGEPWEFHEELIAAFPKLTQGGGYELLRTVPTNNRELFVILPDSGGYSVKYLKPIVNQAKNFVRPIQKDLDLTPRRIW